MPVMAAQNIEDREISNTREFGVEDIVDGEFCVKNNWFTKKNNTQQISYQAFV